MSTAGSATGNKKVEIAFSAFVVPQKFNRFSSSNNSVKMQLNIKAKSDYELSGN
jgi:hypothetical protein